MASTSIGRVGYMEAMERLYEQYPDDPEVAAFYSLSMLSAVAATRDLSGRLNVKAGTIALKLFKDNAYHPGAVHYTIHSFDDPIHAPLALEAAHRFAEIAPAVSHARHMPTHIFIQHGMWDYVSGHNQSAYDAARELWEPGEPMGDATHSLDWGQYGDLQLGDYEKARLWIRRIEKLASGTFLEFGEGGPAEETGQARPRGAEPLLKARYIVDTEEWGDSPHHRRVEQSRAARHGVERGPHRRPDGAGSRGSRAERERRCTWRPFRQLQRHHAQAGGGAA